MNDVTMAIAPKIFPTYGLPIEPTKSRSTIDSLINTALRKDTYKLYGAILGDLVGQPYEHNYIGDYENINLHNPNSIITDDTLMTLASASFILGYHDSIEEAYKDMGRKYPGEFYGDAFNKWLQSPKGITNDSYGNGCLMRISPFMYIAGSLPQMIESVMCSHRHQISIESAMKLFYRYKKGYVNIRNPKLSIDKFKKLDVRADSTIDFCLNLTSQTYGTQKCIIKAVECGGDTDTNASICGELSNYYMKDITDDDASYIESKLDSYLLDILHEFNEKF